jgi:aspartate racemase
MAPRGRARYSAGMDDTARILGVLGGMGPLASAEFMRRLTLLTPATRDQDHIPAVLVSDPRVPDRTAARVGGGEDPLPALLRGIRTLEAAGAGAIAIPCNTAHGWFEGMQAATRLPILHIVDAAAAELVRLGVARGRIGVMGTAGTLAMRLYQSRLEARGYECLVPTDAEMAAAVTPAIARVKANDVASAYVPLADVARALHTRGAAAVVLGCTEIPLGIAAGPALPFPVADTLDALARAAIGWALQPGSTVAPSFPVSAAPR